MTHIAMFDAINTLEREFEPYRVRLWHWGGGSPGAAAAQAAHDVLVGINPAATPTYDAALERQLGHKPSGFVRRGAALGARVAIRFWSGGRTTGGWSRLPTVFRAAAAGTWQPTRRTTRPGIRISESAPWPADGHADLPPPPPSLTASVARPERVKLP